MTTETVVVLPAEPETVVVPVDDQIADAAERVVEAASAAVAMAEVQAAQVIAENEEDMTWLRATVKTQAEQIEALSSTCRSMQEQLSLIPQALAATVEVSAEVAETTATETVVEILTDPGTPPEPTTDTPATNPAASSSTETEADAKSADEKEAAPERRRARGLLRRRK